VLLASRRLLVQELVQLAPRANFEGPYSCGEWPSQLHNDLLTARSRSNRRLSPSLENSFLPSSTSSCHSATLVLPQDMSPHLFVSEPGQVHEFVKLGQDHLVPYYADILGALLPCIADKEEKIRAVSGAPSLGRYIRCLPCLGSFSWSQRNVACLHCNDCE
jgi:hypothetical protein